MLDNCLIYVFFPFFPNNDNIQEYSPSWSLHHLFMAEYLAPEKEKKREILMEMWNVNMFQGI